MHRFEVWAPTAERVELLIGSDRLAMERDTSGGPARPGWWSLAVEAGGPGTDYRYSLDGGPGRPDPRSQWQPAGIDGPSRLVDHNSYLWRDEDWQGLSLDDLVLYE